MKQNRNQKKKDLLALLACIPFGVVGFFAKFVVPGYSFTAVVCLGIIGMILFYTFMPLVGLRYPGFAFVLTRIVTCLLIVGLLAAGTTEAFIIKASFGDPKDHADYMVVLGAKVRDDGPSVSLWDRIYAARDYMQLHPDVVAVVSGGQGADECMSEARSMFENLVNLGIDPERIWMEDKSTSTNENMQFSLNLIEEKTGTRPVKIAVLSSEYHLLRAGLLTRKLGLEFVGVPARTSRWTQLVNHCMREVAGVWQFMILGR